ncbi:MAG: cysteine--tRNA ligase [bacterium]|nr:cysteine--tRNA ligase [bacterium]
MHIQNSLTQQKDEFKTIEPGKVRFYVCGVTVYDKCHIGHARAYVVFDTIKRYLQFSGYEVTHIQNFTDIDDKIIARANEQGITTSELTEANIAHYFTDMDQLNISRATRYPKATEYIPEMISLIQDLISKGVAYHVNGEVLFSVSAKADYGKLSHKVLDDLQSGIRVEVDAHKRNPLDFVLWKPSKQGEPAWDSPWGAGRPGWHTECAAMSMKELGNTIDIHGGGEDLIFPHHENEIAQCECQSGEPFSNYWIHNGFVTIKDEKMSKSSGNFVTLRDILNQFPGEVIRFFLLKSHYRRTLTFSIEGLKEAQIALEKLHHAIKDRHLGEDRHSGLDPESPRSSTTITTLEQKFHAAMADDFNSAEAIGVLFEMVKEINKTKSGAHILKKCGDILGLFYQDLTPTSDEIDIPNEITALAKKRAESKQNKDYATADALRNQIQDAGYTVKDTPNGFEIYKI